MPKLQLKIAALEEELADPELFTKNADRFHAASKELSDAQENLENHEMEWLELEEKREALES